jgi:hypothetical protein
VEIICTLLALLGYILCKTLHLTCWRHGDRRCARRVAETSLMRVPVFTHRPSLGRWFRELWHLRRRRRRRQNVWSSSISHQSSTRRAKFLRRWIFAVDAIRIITIIIITSRAGSADGYVRAPGQTDVVALSARRGRQDGSWRAWLKCPI